MHVIERSHDNCPYYHRKEIYLKKVSRHIILFTEFYSREITRIDRVEFIQKTKPKICDGSRIFSLE